MRLFFVLAAITICILYSSGLTAPFYLDDFVVLQNAERVETTMRWLGYTSFWLSHKTVDWFGLVFPWDVTLYYRFFNVLIHICAATAVFWLARELTNSRLTAGLAGALFMVHPLQTQAITYVSQRFESQAALFMFISAAAYVRFRRGHSRYWLILTAAAAIAAGLTKENAVALPIWLLAIELIFFSGIPRLAKLAYWTPMVLAIAYPAYLTFSSSGDTLIWMPFEFYLLSQGAVLFQYLKLVVWPEKLFLLYDFQPTTVMNAIVVGKWLVVLAVFAAGIYLARKKPAIGFGILTFFILLLPTSIAPLPDMIFEHRMYPAMAGVSIALASAFRPTRRTLALFMVVFLLLGYRTYTRNAEWKDRVAFFESHRREFPNEARVLASLATAYATRGEVNKAIEANLQAKQNLGRLNAFYYKSAVVIVDLNLALLYVQGGTEKQALEEAQRVLSVEPKQETALRIVGDLQLQAGQFGEARKTYERLLLLTPTEEIWRRVAQASESQGDSLRASEATKKADALTPKSQPQQTAHAPMSDRYRLGVLFGSIFGALAIIALILRFLYSQSKGVLFWLRTGQQCPAPAESTLSVDA